LPFILLYLSSLIYIFAALEISLPYPNVINIYRGGMVWGYGVVFSENPAYIPPNNRVIV